MRARSWSGLSATTIWMVEQFGFAMMPLCQARSCGFTSGTTSGQAGSIRHAELLSMTTAPWRTAFGARSRLASPPAEKMAMSIPAKFASVASWQTTIRPANVIFAPATPATSSGRSSFTGNRRCSSVRIISVPTMPAAPTTATFHSLWLTPASLKPRHHISSAFGSCPPALDVVRLQTDG